jgi:hypothetical protein
MRYIGIYKKEMNVVIERTEEGILIKTAAAVNLRALQRMIDYCNALEISSRAQGTQEQADELAKESQKG